MARRNEHFRILTAAAANKVPDWYSTKGAAVAILAIKITGSVTVTISLDPLGSDGANAISLGDFTTSVVKKLRDPVGFIQAKTTLAQGGSTAQVDLYLVG